MRLSVVIPIKDEADALGITLASLEKSTFRDFEVIVVNDGGSKAVNDFCINYRNNAAFNLKVINYNKVRGAYYARNLGVNQAKAGWILFLDSDMVFGRNIIKNIAKKYISKYDYVTAHIELKTTENQSFAEKVLSKGAFDFREGFKKENYGGGTGFAFIKKSAFHAVGGFDGDLFSCEDRRIGKKLFRNGFKMAFCDEETVFHLPKSLQQHKWSYIIGGRENYIAHKRYPKDIPKPLWIPLAFLKLPVSLFNIFRVYFLYHRKEYAFLSFFVIRTRVLYWRLISLILVIKDKRFYE